MYKPPESFQNRGEVGVDQYVSDLHKQILKTHELARDKLKSSQKSMKRDLRVREQKFKVGDLIYWRRNVVKKVESVWRGPGVIIYVNSDSVYIVKSRRKQKVMHHDKLKLCESRKLPKWLVDFQSRGTSNLPQSSKTNRNDYCVGYSLKPKLKGKTDQASVPDGP